MNGGHVESLQLLATPFREDTPQPFAIGPSSTWASITDEIRAYPDYAASSSHAATTRNVLPRQVRMPGRASFAE
jgi:hypothetical protein